MTLRNLILSFLIIGVLTSCGSTKKTTSTTTIKHKLEAQFKKYKGIKYKYGGIDKRGFDCSGFVNKVYKDTLNIQLPRRTKDIAKLGKKVKKSQLKIGDLVFFRPQ